MPRQRPGERRDKFPYWTQGEGLKMVEEWVNEGYTNYEIADKMGISPCTISTWRRKYESFDKALTCGMQNANSEVEAALFKVAAGRQKITEVVKELRMGEDGVERLVTVKKVMKTNAPNITAARYWLNNRDPENWKDQREIDIKTDGPVILQGNGDVLD